MARETGEYMNAGVQTAAAESGIGLGEGFGQIHRKRRTDAALHFNTVHEHSVARRMCGKFR